jgi:hypothetical protein
VANWPEFIRLDHHFKPGKFIVVAKIKADGIIGHQHDIDTAVTGMV